eukprot:CAMPEP_0198199636 /NCGR_PEP_ID=MMETSP1445-20131203/2870_1 /TAXON_ID=36898 /ORGANISM="Pyramimonas sp., Strain CCMP2087" /LENGTH=261 /DNA_ID=CAMNT_0043869521 /DNA_START=238 /DNA_END=1019 /DNA_ORIENTATION=+
MSTNININSRRSLAPPLNPTSKVRQRVEMVDPPSIGSSDSLSIVEVNNTFGIIKFIAIQPTPVAEGCPGLNGTLNDEYDCEESRSDWNSAHLAIPRQASNTINRAANDDGGLPTKGNFNDAVVLGFVDKGKDEDAEAEEAEEAEEEEDKKAKDDQEEIEDKSKDEGKEGDEGKEENKGNEDEEADEDKEENKGKEDEEAEQDKDKEENEGKEDEEADEDEGDGSDTSGAATDAMVERVRRMVQEAGLADQVHVWRGLAGQV